MPFGAACASLPEVEGVPGRLQYAGAGPGGLIRPRRQLRPQPPRDLLEQSALQPFLASECYSDASGPRSLASGTRSVASFTPAQYMLPQHSHVHYSMT